MAEVKVNRELLTDLVEDLQARHDATRACCLAFIASEGKRGGLCPTAQRLERVRGVMERSTPIEVEQVLSHCVGCQTRKKCEGITP